MISLPSYHGDDSCGASIEAKNRVGVMVWDYAIESEDLRLLTALVNVYKEMKGGSEPFMFIGQCHAYI